MITRAIRRFLFLVLPMLACVNALYFYLEADDKRCFLEELPNDTVVVGHYMAEEWDRDSQKFTIQQDLGIQIVVKEVKDDHVVTSTRGPPEGKFAFTSHEAGDHQICLSTNYTTPRSGTPPQVRMHLDIIIGDAKPDTQGRDREHIRDLAGRVRDLNAKLRDIRREQQFQREREADFRNLSEQTNARAIWWSCLQLVTLVGTCVWQLRNLRGFFEGKKLA